MYIPVLVFCFIQGFTEFLPISSQGHLIFFNTFFPLDQSIDVRTLNIIAHFGSLIAIIIYYHKEVISLCTCIPNFFRSDIDNNVLKFKNIIVSSIPLYICGYIISLFVNNNFLESLEIIGWTSLVFGILLYFIDKNCLRIKTLENMPIVTAFYVGIIQCLAIIPGVSRSGAVITILRLFGYSRIESANYSNLLSIPAILGAIGYLVITQDNSENYLNILTIVIFTLSFLFSIIFIHFMISWLKKSSYAIFMYYRIFLSLLILFLTYFNSLNISW